ncbi:MAG TPA: sigma-54 dependent transcriptional regulator [Methylomirabilota bacterium]
MRKTSRFAQQASREETARVPRETPYLAKYMPLFSLSSCMRALANLVQEVARTDATVLVLGESGVGKNLIARTIHEESARQAGPFVVVNCAALPGELLESELFGHEKGAFTGAYRQTPGKFEYASRGTLCLDEIGEIPRSLQAKLLHVLQDLEFSRVGGREPIRVDVRVIATTNRDLEAAMRLGEFREDLYYRLSVLEIRVPPLRERREAIEGLARIFLDRCNAQYGRKVAIQPELASLMTEYAWPGNVRELENFVRRLVVLGEACRAQQDLAARVAAAGRNGGPGHADRGGGLAPSAASPAAGAPPTHADPGLLDLKAIARRAAQDAEKKALLEVLERVRWNRAEAARVLKVSYKTLLSKLAQCGITARRGRGKPSEPLT